MKIVLVILVCLLAAVGVTFGMRQDRKPQIQEQREARKLDRRNERYSHASWGMGKITDNPNGATRTVIADTMLRPSRTEAERKADLSVNRRRLVCSADLIVVGESRKKESSFTKDETYVFTTYQLLVKEVWKNNQKDPVAAGQMLEFTVPGGIVVRNGKKYGATDPTIKCSIAAQSQAIFLKYDGEADDYYLFDAEGNYLFTPAGAVRADLTKDRASLQDSQRLGIPSTVLALKAEVMGNLDECR